MRILYFDCFSGISGDMTLASLVDAGADQAYIEEELNKIKIEPFHLEWSTVNKQGITAKRLQVVVPDDHKPHHHRHYGEIVKLIQEAGFNERVTEMSLSIFEKIGRAEAKIHGIALEQVHFHEVGAIDSIVDTIGVALAIDSLDVQQIAASPVPLGSGMVRCDHGLYPVPAPATLEIMKGLPIAPSKHKKELTTPTGAGIITALVNHFSYSLPAMIVEQIGYGAGTRDLPNQPNVLRTIVGTTDEHHHDHGHGHHHHHDHEHAHDHSHHHHDDEHTHEHGHHHHDHDHVHHHDHQTK